MSQSTNLNVNPYYDDFDSQKNYYKVLFKPGVTVQARELTTLQSILQDQIEKFGSSFYANGGIVIPGNFAYDGTFTCVEVESTYKGVDVETYFNSLIGKIVKGKNTGITAKIESVLSRNNSIRDTTTLYVKYQNSSSEDFSTEIFENGEELSVTSNVSIGNTLIESGQDVFRVISPLDRSACSVGSAAKIESGVYFVRGFFVDIDSDLIILDQYTNTPSYRVGLKITESIVDANDDSSLFDNAQGFSNFAAPGADRFKISLTLTKKEPDNFVDNDFIELFKVENGIVKKIKQNDKFSFINEILARRTFDESGNYYVSPFEVESFESLNDRLGNQGLYLSNEKTPDGSTPSDDLAVLKVSPGKAYVKGFEISTSDEILDLPKPRNTKEVESSSSNFYAANLIKVNNVQSLPKIGLTTDFTVSLYDTRLDGSASVSAGTTIGLAKIYDFESDNTSYVDASSQSNLYLFDIQTYTNLTLSSSVSAGMGEYIQGQYSNASGYVQSGSGGNLSLYQVSGEFLDNEPLIISGISTNTTITEIEDYSIQDVKSFGFGDDFAADTLLSKELLIDGPFDFESSAGVATITRFDGSAFATGFKVNDIVKYSRTGGANEPRFARITSINSSLTGIGVTDVANVSNVCTGDIDSTTTLQTIKIIRPEVINFEDSSLYSRLNNTNISEISFLNSSIFIKKYYDGQTISGNSITLPSLLNTDFVYAAFDEERYSLVDDSGNGVNLSSATFNITNGGKDAEFTGLSVATASSAKIITTQIKSNISQKFKKLQKAQSVVLNRTKYSPTRNGGLTNSTVYGTRVEDNEISLNYADIVEVHGVYQSSTTSDPELPSITFSGANSSNFKLGEVLIGKTSGAVAVYVEQNSNSKISFVYKSNNKFIVSEVVEFQDSSQNATVLTVNEGEENIISDFILDNGQRKQFYDFGRLVRKESTKEPSSRLKIVFDYFKFESTDSGDLVGANSYQEFLDKDKIPFFNGLRNSDSIDIRPRVSDYNTASSMSPFDFKSRSFDTSSNNSTQVLSSNESIVFDYSFYLPRIDKLTLDKNGKFDLVFGESSETPVKPQISEDVLDVATILSSAYVYDVNRDIDIVLTDNRRFTFSDIRDIEKRVDNLELTSTLSLLEVDTKNLLIQDSEGFNRFKSGFFVDDFQNFDTSDVKSPIFKANISNGSLKSEVNKNRITLKLDSNTNTQITGHTLTLSYSENDYQKQPFASRIVNVNPFNIVTWTGKLELNPSNDSWTIEISSSERVGSATRGGETEVIRSSRSIEFIRSRNIEFIGTRLKPSTEFSLIFDSRNLSSNLTGTTYAFPKLLQITSVVGTFNVGETVNGFDNNGNRISFRTCTANHKTGVFNNPDSTYNINPYDPTVQLPSSYGPQSTVLNVDTSSLQISNESSFFGNATSGMRLFGTESGAIATISALKLVSDDNGTLIGSVFIPDPDSSSLKFRTGNASVKLTTSTAGLGVPGEFTSTAETVFNTSGTRIEIRTVTYYDPLAQTFIVDEPEGIFPTSIDVFFATKDDTIPVTLQIREVINGIPGGPDKIVGSLEKILNPNEVKVSKDSSVATNFKFDNLTRLEGGREYAIVLISDSSDYQVWISRVGEIEISTQSFTEAQKVLISKQPSLGSLFKSQNGTTWIPTPEDDLKFTIKNAKFNTTGGTSTFFNSEVNARSNENKLAPNSIFSISTDASEFNNGRYILVFHPNHGMYSSTNKVVIEGVKSDILPEKLTIGYGITSSGAIDVSDSTIFQQFEGSTVSNSDAYIEINGEIIKYENVSGNQLTDITRGQFGTKQLDHPVNSLVRKYEFNNVSLAGINTEHDVISPTIDSYYVQVESGKQFSESKFGGGDKIFASRNKQFSKLEFENNFIRKFESTSVDSSIRTVSSTSVDGTEVSFKDKGFESVGINSTNTFTDPRMVCSRVNETTSLNSNQFKDNKSFTLQLTLSTDNEDLSPVINLNNSNLIVENNRINQPISTNSYPVDGRVNSNVDDPNALIYVSNRIELAQSASSIKVLLSAFRSQFSDIRVLYKIFRDDTPDESQVWQLFPGYLNLDVNNKIVDPSKNDGRSDKLVPSSFEDEYREYSFTIDDLPQFTSFAVKIVGTSTNQAFTPIIEDLRVIALK